MQARRLRYVPDAPIITVNKERRTTRSYDTIPVFFVVKKLFPHYPSC